MQCHYFTWINSLKRPKVPYLCCMCCWPTSSIVFPFSESPYIYVCIILFYVRNEYNNTYFDRMVCAVESILVCTSFNRTFHTIWFEHALWLHCPHIHFWSWVMNKLAILYWFCSFRDDGEDDDDGKQGSLHSSLLVPIGPPKKMLILTIVWFVKPSIRTLDTFKIKLKLIFIIYVI